MQEKSVPSNGLQEQSVPATISVAVLRNAESNDLEDILAFLQHAEGVLPRPAEDFRRAVDNGFFYLVEAEGDLIASAGVFVLNEQSAGGPLEMGSCYVAPSARGFGLQKLLVLPRIAAAVLFLDENAIIFTAVKPDNPASLRSIKAVGFEPALHNEPLLTEPCQACPSKPTEGRICCCDFYYISQNQKCSSISALLARNDIVLRRSSDASEMTVALNIQLLTNSEYRETLVEIVTSPGCVGL